MVFEHSKRPVATLLVSGMLLCTTGCGGTDDDSDARAPDAATPSVSKSSPDTTPQGAERDVSYGIDRTAWPRDLAAARAMFERMPNRLAGLPRKGMGGERSSTPGVLYGPANTGPAAYVMAPTGEMEDPTMMLSFMFGMGYGCKRGTYNGTAAQSRWGGGPDADRSRTFDTDEKLWWFSCDYRGEVPDERGHAVGWVSGDLAWLATALDRPTSRVLVSTLRSRATGGVS